MYVKFEDDTKKRMKSTEAVVLLQQARTLEGQRVALYTNPYNPGVVHAILSKGDDVRELWFEHVGEWGLHVLQSAADEYENGRFW